MRQTISYRLMCAAVLSMAFLSTSNLRAATTEKEAIAEVKAAIKTALANLKVDISAKLAVFNTDVDALLAATTPGNADTVPDALAGLVGQLAADLYADSRNESNDVTVAGNVAFFGANVLPPKGFLAGGGGDLDKFRLAAEKLLAGAKKKVESKLKKFVAAFRKIDSIAYDILFTVRKFPSFTGVAGNNTSTAGLGSNSGVEHAVVCMISGSGTGTGDGDISIAGLCRVSNLLTVSISTTVGTSANNGVTADASGLWKTAFSNVAEGNVRVIIIEEGDATNPQLDIITVGVPQP
ncbi:MAG: hypothetical protein L6R28_08770 [Planctomycetes bacterium]|nr:hypothetical protein [Planctomycetota bacterium]